VAVPPDMLAALQGGAPAPMGGPEAIPPDMLAALGGGAPMPEEAPAPGGDAQALYEAALDQTDDPITLIDWAVGMAQKAAQMEEDPEDTLVLQKATVALQQYLADLQREQDGMMQGKATPKALRRAL
jgi:hypothetical protein